MDIWPLDCRKMSRMMTSGLGVHPWTGAGSAAWLALLDMDMWPLDWRKMPTMMAAGLGIHSWNDAVKKANANNKKM